MKQTYRDAIAAFLIVGLVFAVIALSSHAFAAEPQTYGVPVLKLDNTQEVLQADEGPKHLIFCYEAASEDDPQTGVLTCLTVENGERGVLHIPFAIGASK